MLTKLLVILLSTVALSRAAPAAIYDQRQDGDLNVKVDLDNFVVLVAWPRTSASTAAGDVLGSLADLLAEAKRSSPTTTSANDEVELDKNKDLADVSLSGAETVKEEVERPKEEMLVLLQQDEGADKAGLENVVRTLRNLEPEEKDAKDKSKAVKYKFVESAEDTLSLKLIGDAVENCGPGRSRDRSGICQAQN